jgi:hypothetical protein
MTQVKKVDRFFSGLEWKWSLVNLLWGVPAAIASFALPAWAVKASKVFEQYAPLSWVVAGFIGLASGVLIYSVAAWGRGRWVRARYDSRMLAQGGSIDALEKTFERKRIYLNEFCLPSHPLVEDKAFIDCEIVGPANIIFISGNNISDGRYPICDAVYMRNGVGPYNGYIFKDCMFRGCNFTRVTFLVPFEETEMFKGYSLVRWITSSPYDEQENLNLGEGTPRQLIEGTGSETPQ